MFMYVFIKNNVHLYSVLYIQCTLYILYIVHYKFFIEFYYKTVTNKTEMFELKSIIPLFTGLR